MDIRTRTIEGDGRTVAALSDGSLVAELLPNGFVRVDHRPSGLVGLFERDGRLRHGSNMDGATQQLIATVVTAS